MTLASATGTIPFLQKGKTGRTPKFMGVYSEDVTYTSDDYVAPLVLHVIYNVDGDPVSGIKSTDYYIMFGDNYAWTGKNETLKPWEEAAKQNDDPTKRWSLFAGFSTIAAEIAFIRYGLLAGAVCCQEGDARNGYTYAKMFSQTGEDGTTNYEKFDPSLDAEDAAQKWRPKLCLDFKNGKLYAMDGVFGGNVEGVTGSFKKLSALNREGKELGYISFGTDSGISAALNMAFDVTWFSGDIYSQGGKDGRSLRYYASDIWCRGSFGARERNVAVVAGNTIYYFSKGLNADPVAVELERGQTSEGQYYFTVPCYGGTGDASGFPVDTLIFSGNSYFNLAYYYLLSMSYSQRVMLINTNDYTATSTPAPTPYIYSNGKAVLIAGGVMREVIQLNPNLNIKWDKGTFSLMNPIVNTGYLGRGLMLGPEYDNDWR